MLAETLLCCVWYYISNESIFEEKESRALSRQWWTKCLKSWKGTAGTLRESVAEVLLFPLRFRHYPQLLALHIWRENPVKSCRKFDHEIKYPNIVSYWFPFYFGHVFQVLVQWRKLRRSLKSWKNVWNKIRMSIFCNVRGRNVTEK